MDSHQKADFADSSTLIITPGSEVLEEGSKMKLLTDGMLCFSSGRVFKPAFGIVGVDSSLNIFSGYDSKHQVEDGEDNEFSQEELAELADFMIERWHNVKCKALPAGGMMATENGAGSGGGGDSPPILLFTGGVVDSGGGAGGSNSNGGAARRPTKVADTNPMAIAVSLAWLLKQPYSIEREHIEAILRSFFNQRP